MKECPKCHTQYDDGMNFCTKDGCQLVNVGTTSAYQPKMRKKGGCLKKVVVAMLLIGVALAAFYSYIMNAASYLRAEPNRISAVKAGGECKIDIDYDGYVWLINHKPDWVDVDENDNDFTIKVNPNLTGQAREGSITIQSGKQLAQVVIQQMGYATRLKADETQLKFSSGGGSKTLVISTDGCGWEAQFPDWITVRDDEDGAVIICERNTGEYRTGHVTFRENNVSAIVYVTQGGICNNCHGEGEITCSNCLGRGGFGIDIFYSQCIWCGGAGKFKCSTCDGTGERE